MKKTVINENQRGFLFRNGKFVKLLAAGKHYTFGDSEIEVTATDMPLHSERCDLRALIQNEEISKQISVVEVNDTQLALHFVNGRFASALGSGIHAFWEITDRHEFQIVDISTPDVSGVPEYIFAQLPAGRIYTKIEVGEYQKARLYFDNKLVRILDAGTYYFWKTNTKVDYSLIDTRLQQMDITGQEMLTLDKVSLRINFVCNYRIVDYVKCISEVDDYKEQLHVAAQLALREYIGKHKMDDILADKEELSAYVFERIREKEKVLFIEVSDAGVKDIILPGEVREIMNTVLIAEKQAQANVISRREEVASTRSLLNTAKLLEENATLYKLKELEYIERICENVGNINLTGSSDVLSQLMTILRNGQ